MALYAEELINESWGGGSALTKEKCPKFAADVLMHVRNKFYSHIEEEDALARASGVPIKVDPPNAPPTRKLVLENMKWVFDTKIKPLTEQFQKELFLCNGCENNTKLYGFEGVVQHYAAKHTNVLSLGNVVVHWRAEWPEKPPFHPNPNAAKALFHAIPHNSIGQSPGYPGQHGGPGLYMATPEQRHRMPSDGPPVYPHQSPGPYGRSPFSAPFPYVQGPYRPPSPSMSPYYSASHTGYRYPPPQPGLQNAPYEQHIPPPPMYGSPYLGTGHPANYQPHDSRISHPYPSPGYGPPPQAAYAPPFRNPSRSGKRSGQTYPYTNPNNRLSAYQNQLDEMARIAREVWNRTSGIKDLPSSIRAHVLIHYVVSAPKDQFLYEPTITLFADGLNNHPQMKPIRNLSGLACRTCVDGDDYESPHSWSGDRKLYTLPALVSHFQSMHLERIKSSATLHKEAETLSLDWRYDMVHLPDSSIVISFLHAPGMDDVKLQLIADAFPGVFPSPFPLMSPGISPLARSSISHQKPRSDFQWIKRQTRDAEVSSRHNSSISYKGRKADNSSPNRRALEMTVDHLTPMVGSPRSNEIMPLELPGRRGNDHDHYRPSVVEPVHGHGSRRGSQRLLLQPERDEVSHELSQQPRLNRSYDHASSQVRPVHQIPDEETSEKAESRNLFSGPHTLQSNFTNKSGYHCRQYTGERQHYDSNLVEQQPAADHRIDSRYTPSRKASEEGELSENATRSKVNQGENGPTAGEMNAAERFLNSFIPGQDADVYQGNGSESDHQRDRSSTGQWLQSKTSEERHWPPDRVSGGTTENSLRLTPARQSTHNGWKRWSSLGPTNGREHDLRPDIRSNGGDQMRQYDGRSPDLVDNRYGRKISNCLDSRRPHSRFDRYEAQRQESLRPRSKSPSIRDSIPVDGAFLEEHNPHSQSRPRSLYSDHPPRKYRRVESTVAYSRMPQQGDYRYVDDPGCVESLYDDSVEYLPLGATGGEFRSSGTYYDERTSHQDASRDHPGYEMGFSRQSAYEHSNQVYSARILSPHTLSPKDTIRRRALYR
ncbi:hypothetical protein VTN77DRAFT_5922 [Rasamsonia byssochlamydoides]|uniref:uncharacterized protein n=1 Tax=Rasamsonia byssochlamydoides TaxID=89139 RepID=UPI00374219B5